MTEFLNATPASAQLNDILGIDTTAVEQAAPVSPMEKALVVVEPSDIQATDMEQVKFQFRSLLPGADLEQLRTRAPAIAQNMVQDLNQVLTFGEPVLKKMNDSAVSLLEAQRDIRLPEADAVVNDLLREMDGFERKFRTVKLEETVSKVKQWFIGAKYSLKTMIRELQPITEKLDMAEAKILDMEGKLADNVKRGQLLHRQTLEQLDNVVKVLAAIEEIIDCVSAEYRQADAALTTGKKSEADGVALCDWKSERITVNQMSEIHAQMSTALSEIEKTWFDWRQQFFIGFAHAPSTRNLVITEFALRRRLQTFRTMGIPAARHSLALWQQAALAKQGAELGEKVQEGVNKMIQQSFEGTADAVSQVARAAQAPLITEETVFTVIDSVKRQCQEIVSADIAGRQLRDRNLKALERGETVIKDEFNSSQRQLAEHSLVGVAPEPTTNTIDDKAPDLLKSIGVD